MHTHATTTLPKEQTARDIDSGGRIPVFASRLGSWHLSLQRQPYDLNMLTASYDRAAARWQRTIDRLNYLPAYSDLLRRALDHGHMAGLPRQSRVLDCGTGTGALSEALAGVCKEPLKIEAVDISPAMLARAEARLRGISADVELRQADIQQLPYATGSFDIVMAGHILEHLPDPVAALREMVRVARPGGLIFTCITRRTLLGLWVHFLWRTHMVTPAQARHWLGCAGLNDVRCVMPGRASHFRKLSVACCGVKPANTGQPAGIRVRQGRDQ